MGNQKNGSNERARIVGVALTAVALSAGSGCQAAPATPMHGAMNMKDEYEVLHFKTHGFSAWTYNTIGCKVLYANRFVSDDSEEEVQPPPYGPGYRDAWGGSGMVGIDNFPKPAEVTWKSMDGTSHHALVDIGAIFKNERVVHHVRKGEVKTNLVDQDLAPDIIMEINDRTIRVFMQAHVGTKHLQDSTRPLSDFRNDLIEVWSRTY